MAKHRRQQSLAFGLAVIGLLGLCAGAAAQPAPNPSMPQDLVSWKQSLERPNRRWDYDGKRILGHVGHDICLWDATTGKLLQRMKGHHERIHAVQFSPDGQQALSSSWMGQDGMAMQISRDTSSILWDLATGQNRQVFKSQVAGEFSPDGKRIVSFSQRPGTGIAKPDWGQVTLPSTGEVWQRGTAVKFDAAIVWDTSTGRQLAKVKLDEDSDPKWDALHFSPDGRRFVLVANGAFVLYNSSGGVVFNTEDGRELGRVSRDAVRFGGGHRYTSSGALASFEPTQARLINLESGRVTHSIPHDLEGIWGTAWTHDGSRFAAIPSGESELTIGDIKTGKLTTGAKVGPYPHKTAIVSPDNSRLAVSWGGSNVEGRDIEPGLGIYDMITGAEIAKDALANSGELVGFSPDSKSLLVGGSKFVVYDAQNGKQVRTLDRLDEFDPRE